MNNERIIVWHETPLNWAMLALGCVLLGVIFYDGIRYIIGSWSSEEYSHAYMLPLVALFFVWQKKNILATQPLSGSWSGLLVIMMGIAGYVFGELSSLYIIVQYSFLLTLLGLILVFVGTNGFRLIWAAFFLLLFVIPLPAFLFQALSSELQLISSKLGVAVIRLFNISVFLEGNVIDLGTMKLQVVEACSGLRYLFPLMALGFIAAYLYKAPLWKRLIVFFSTMPITVLMNSIRIGIIGVTVEYWGKGAAEGFLHDFEGWVVFMACTAMLVLEMWLLQKIGGKKIPLRDAFSLELPAKNNNVVVKSRKLPYPVIPAVVILSLAMVMSLQLPDRTEIQPVREKFVNFPMNFDSWSGERSRIEKIYVDALKFEDYIMANYQGSGLGTVNFYVAYYGSQRKGESAHSPRTCIPGGGWKFEEFGQKILDTVKVNNQSLQVNRALIQHGENRQLVYYWFQQRGRVITNEYLVKWYLFWDSLTKNRTDGSLVRLTINIPPGLGSVEADKILENFSKSITPLLPKYVPN